MINVTLSELFTKTKNMVVPPEHLLSGERAQASAEAGRMYAVAITSGNTIPQRTCAFYLLS